MITLSSDFGWPYPAAMRGVIAEQYEGRLIDVSHQFPRGDITTAAFWLREILPYFPPAVHLAVIDPGVGTDRAVLAIKSDGHVLVGPDNGVLWPAACRLCDDPNPYVLTEVDADSATFHGRDVFAPLAASIATKGIDSLVTAGLLASTDAPVTIDFPTADVSKTGATGTVLVIDCFGNVITNIPGTIITEKMGQSVSINGRAVPVAPSYAHVGQGEALVTIGSHGNVELAENDGRGTDAFSVTVGDTIELAFES